uniref:Uncharacterized protein n=1 Tax=Glossina pallidipes TaxID=7398 RepID=A0A1A9ZM26_GLOPL
MVRLSLHASLLTGPADRTSSALSRFIHTRRLGLSLLLLFVELVEAVVNELAADVCDTVDVHFAVAMRCEMKPQYSHSIHEKYFDLRLNTNGDCENTNTNQIKCNAANINVSMQSCQIFVCLTMDFKNPCYAYIAKVVSIDLVVDFNKRIKKENVQKFSKDDVSYSNALKLCERVSNLQLTSKRPLKIAEQLSTNEH